MANIYEVAGIKYRSFAAAKKAAQKKADSSGTRQYIQETLGANTAHPSFVTIGVSPKKRTNPTAARSNPSDSALAGARILGVTRNRAGKVTALKLQLKAGAGKSTRKNPAASGNGGDRLPALSNWHMFAGGTSAAPGKHGYSFNTGAGDYHISPVSTKYGKHRGYMLTVYRAPGHGLSHNIGGLHRSPGQAVTAARAFQSKL